MTALENETVLQKTGKEGPLKYKCKLSLNEKMITDLRMKTEIQDSQKWEETSTYSKDVCKPSSQITQINHFIIYYFLKSPQLCPTLSEPVDCSAPGSSVHGILQARIVSGVGCPALLKAMPLLVRVTNIFIIWWKHLSVTLLLANLKNTSISPILKGFIHFLYQISS